MDQRPLQPNAKPSTALAVIFYGWLGVAVAGVVFIVATSLAWPVFVVIASGVVAGAAYMQDDATSIDWIERHSDISIIPEDLQRHFEALDYQREVNAEARKRLTAVEERSVQDMFEEDVKAAMAKMQGQQ